MDGAGNTTATYGYDVFGRVRTQTGTSPNYRLFTGQRQYGAKSGIYYYGARFYSADIGRFLSPDSIVPGAGDPQALNRYSYVLNNPIRYSDPTGHKWDDDAGGCTKNTCPEVWEPGPVSDPTPSSADVGAGMCAEIAGAWGGECGVQAQGYACSYRPSDCAETGGGGSLWWIADAGEWVPFFGIDIASSGVKFAMSCDEDGCDYYRIIDVAPLSPPGSGKFLRKISHWAGFAGGAARVSSRVDHLRDISGYKEHLSLKDLTAAQAELAGKPIAPGNHLQEVREAQQGLATRITDLQNLLGDTRISQNQRASLESSLSEASRLLDYSEGFVPR